MSDRYVRCAHDEQPSKCVYCARGQIERLRSQLADEQSQHASTLQHNAGIGTALTECRLRLASAEALLRLIGNETVDGRVAVMASAYFRKADSASVPPPHMCDHYERPDGSCELCQPDQPTERTK